MFKTVPASGTVSISQSPPNVVNKGSDVELHCASSSLNTRSINWIRNRHTVSFRSSLRLSSVTDEDGGLYVCKVLYDDSTTVKKEWNLNIKCKSFVDTQAISMGLLAHKSSLVPTMCISLLQHLYVVTRLDRWIFSK